MGNRKSANQNINMKKKWGKRKTNDNYIIASSNNLKFRYFNVNLIKITSLNTLIKILN